MFILSFHSLKTIHPLFVIFMKVLTDYLEKEGFKVERSYILDTAFRATFGSDNGVNVCVICEYDALPEIGHACGHNLIAEVGIGAGIAIKAGLEALGGQTGKVCIILYIICRTRNNLLLPANSLNRN